MKKIKTSKKSITALFVLLLLVLLAIPFCAVAAQEEKGLVVGDTWEKDGWKLIIRAVEINAEPRSTLISLSYQGKNLGDAKIKNDITYTYIGRDPDGDEMALFAVKSTSVFVGTAIDAVRLELNWSIPENNVQILDVPVESDQAITKTPAPTPAAQTSPKVPGFGVILSVISLLVVMMRRRKT